MLAEYIMKLLVCAGLVTLFGVPASADLVHIETDTKLQAVYLVEDPDSSRVVVNPVFRIGEVDAQGPHGMSHYLEHLMFWHADKAGGKKIHGRGGNAWVNGIFTSYYSEGDRATELDDLFDFAARLLTPPELNKKFMLDEKRVVEREYDFRVSENADRILIEKMLRELFGKHPAGRSVIGTPQSIRALDLDYALEFHHQYYVPAYMVLFVRGNLSPARVRELVEKSFGEIDAGNKHSQAWRERGADEELNARIDQVSRNSDSSAYKYFATGIWEGSGDRLQDNYTSFLLRKLLNSSLPGSLAKPLRLDNFFASGLSSSVDPLVEGQIQYGFFARPDDGVELEELAAKFKSALGELAKNGIADKSIERVRKRLLREAARRAHEPKYILERSYSFLRNGVEPNNSEDHVRRLKAVSKADIDSLLTVIANPVRSVDGYLKKEN